MIWEEAVIVSEIGSVGETGFVVMGVGGGDINLVLR